MMNASGIRKIVIGGSVTWLRVEGSDNKVITNILWKRITNKGKVELKKEEKLLKYVKHLILNEGYTNVWTSGDTVNVRKPDIPEAYVNPHASETRDQGERGISTGFAAAALAEIIEAERQKSLKTWVKNITTEYNKRENDETQTNMRHGIPRPGAHPKIQVGDRVCVKTPPNDSNIDCMIGIVEAMNTEVVLIRCTKNGNVRRLGLPYFEENYMWVEHKGGGN